MTTKYRYNPILQKKNKIRKYNKNNKNNNNNNNNNNNSNNNHVKPMTMAYTFFLCLQLVTRVIHRHNQRELAEDFLEVKRTCASTISEYFFLRNFAARMKVTSLVLPWLHCENTSILRNVRIHASQ